MKKGQKNLYLDKHLVLEIRLLAFAIILLIGIEGSYAQPYYFRHYMTENGLSNNTATSVMQDKNGFLWIGTLDGLNRFDGYSFTTFRSKPTDTTGVGCNRIWRILDDEDDKIWLGTDMGIFFFDKRKEKFSTIPNAPVGSVTSIVKDKNGVVWMAIGGKLYYYDVVSEKLVLINNDNYFMSLTITQDNGLWAGTVDGKVGSYNLLKRTFIFYAVFDHSPKVDSRIIYTLFNSGEDYLLVGTMHQGIKKFNLKDGTYTDVLSHNDQGIEIYVRDFIKINDHEYWVATESGIYIYNTTSNYLVNLKKNDHNPYAVSDNAIYSFCKDKEGGLWISTYFGGLNYYPNTKPVFEKYVAGTDSNSIHGNAIREITEDNKGNLWIGSEDHGLNKFNLQSKKFTWFHPTAKKNEIAHTNIHGLLCDGDDLYIGLFNHGLDIMNLKTEKITHHFSAGTGIDDMKSNFPFHIYKAHDNNIWISTTNGIYTYNKQQRKFQLANVFPESPSTNDVFSGKDFYTSITETRDSTMWAGTLRGDIFYYNTRKDIRGSLHIQSKGHTVLNQVAILSIIQAKDGTLWIATYNGLFHVNIKTSDVKAYYMSEGLPSDMVFTITEDKQGRYWITTSKGLAMLDTDLKTIRTFKQSDGLLGDQFNYNSAYLASDGKIYCGSLKGMISFNPSSVTFDTYIPSIYFTNFSIFNIPLKIDQKNGPLYQPLLNTNYITLKHNQSSFTIDFAAVCYTAPNNVQYAYKMENLDDKWVYLKSNRSVNFTGLPYGEYLFKVRSTNGSGVWQNNERMLRIIILPPFWKTIWAYCMYILLVFIIIYLIARTYKQRLISKQKRQAELYKTKKEKELYAAKMDFFTKVAHEIKTPLTLIKAPMERVIDETRNMEEVQDYLSIMDKNTERLLVLTNELLNLNTIETTHYALDMSPINIYDLLNEIYHNFRLAIEAKKIFVEYDLDKNVSMIKGNRDALIKIISNLLDNAIKYCNQRILIKLMMITDDSNMAKLTISNDGLIIPMELSQKIFEPFFRVKETEKISGNGIGLSIARSLAELHNGYLQYNNEKHLNNFVLCIPAIYT